MKTTSIEAEPATGSLALLIGTRKGAFILRGDKSRRNWKLSGPALLGSSVHHMVMDPRDGRTILVAARTGHLGPTVFRSTDRKSWKEASQPQRRRVVDVPGSSLARSVLGRGCGMKVRVPTPLRSYTHRKGEIEATGSTLAVPLQPTDEVQIICTLSGG